MSTYTLGKEEIEKLSNNEWVKRCSRTSITYTTQFKTQAIMQFRQGMNPRDIFKGAGLDIALFREKYPHECLKRWRKIIQRKGAEGLTESRGLKATGRPKTKGVTEAEKIKRLELQAAYLKAENDFLAKLRAKRTE